MILHQSDIQAFTRCAHAWKQERDGAKRLQLSATAFGSVVHHAIHAGSRSKSVDVALETFEFYWHPLNISAVCEPVDIWLPRESYGSLLIKGRNAIRQFFDELALSEDMLLALEYEFMVPLHGVIDPLDGSTVVLGGTIDRLVARRHRRRLILCADDLKTGKKKTYLRWNVQGTAYCYATTQSEFWLGWESFHTTGFGESGVEMMSRFATAPRKFNWIDLSEGKANDGGYRGERDYAALKYAAQQVVNMIRSETFPLSLSGEVCQFCPHRPNCAGVGLDDKDGDPFA